MKHAILIGLLVAGCGSSDPMVDGGATDGAALVDGASAPDADADGPGDGGGGGFLTYFRFIHLVNTGAMSGTAPERIDVCLTTPENDFVRLYPGTGAGGTGGGVARYQVGRFVATARNINGAFYVDASVPCGGAVIGGPGGPIRLPAGATDDTMVLNSRPGFIGSQQYSTRGTLPSIDNILVLDNFIAQPGAAITLTVQGAPTQPSAGRLRLDGGTRVRFVVTKAGVERASRDYQAVAGGNATVLAYGNAFGDDTYTIIVCDTLAAPVGDAALCGDQVRKPSP